MKKNRFSISALLPVCLFLLLFSTSARAQDAIPKAGSAVKITAPQEAVTTVNEITTANSISVTQYNDGLGRPNMKVAHRVTPTGKDLVTMVSYDMEGRVKESWIPTPVTASSSAPNPATVMQQARSFHNDTHPYAKNEFQSNSIGDCMTLSKHTVAGKDWHNNNKRKTVMSLVNDQEGTDMLLKDVRRYFCVGTGSQLAIQYSTFYPTASLIATIMEDEDGKIVASFTDAMDRTILERKVFSDAENIFYDTYYVYDDKGYLLVVASPEASDQMTEANKIYRRGPTTIPNQENYPLKQYSYLYEYDGWGNCIKKKLPGGDWIHFVYDQSGRLILSQDGNQRENKQWSFTTYDIYGRTLQEGTLNNVSPTHLELIDLYKNKVITEIWTSEGYSSTQSFYGTKTVLNTYYYDNYDFIDIPAYASIRSKLLYANSANYGKKGSRIENGVDISTLGMLTGVATRMLEDTTNVIVEASYYDNKGRIVLRKSNEHFIGEQVIAKYAYNFNHSISQEYHSHKHNSGTYARSMEYLYNYDQTGRRISTRQSIRENKNYLVVDSLEYNELGQVKRKLLHNGEYPSAYNYNIHGRLTSINSPLFTQDIKYQDGENKYYNGNISQINESIPVDNTQGLGRFQLPEYKFTYDGVNRLTTTTIFITGIYLPEPSWYDTKYTYDKNGNITSLKRNGPIEHVSGDVWYRYYSWIDNLNMTYEGNQLSKVSDQANMPDLYQPGGDHHFVENPVAITGNHYLYDKNGNLKADHHKNIAWVQYNSLNLPNKIQMGNGDKTEYLYDGLGNKRRAKYSIAQNSMQIPLGATGTENTSNIKNTVVKDYVGQFIYLDGKCDRILIPGGYIICHGTTDHNQWEIVYQITDHLGHVRCEIDAGKAFKVTEGYTMRSYSAYYPFGMEMSVPSGESPQVQPYQLSGNERERTNTDWHDFHHRWYDQQLGRFLSIDPLAELDYSVSPYAYCRNNPINMVDPWGLSPTDDDDDGFYGGELKEVIITPKKEDTDNNNAWYWIREAGQGNAGNFTEGYTLPVLYETPLETQRAILMAEQGITQGYEFEPMEILRFTDKHFNGQLAIVETSVGGYNKVSHKTKRKYAYKLSKRTGVKSGKIYQDSKKIAKKTGKVTGKLGPVGNALTIGVIGYEFSTNTWDASTVIDGLLIGGAVAATIFGSPVLLTGIAAYGIGDYFFDFSGKIDNNFGRNSGRWD